MKDMSTLHQKVQELIDCYATSDPLREMSVVHQDGDKQEAALKWLALAALHGVNENAEKITISQSGDGSVKVVAKYRKSELPNPGQDVGGKVFDTMQQITHLEGEKTKIPLALGIRDSSIDVKVKLKMEEGGKKLSIKFPAIEKP